MFVNIKMNTTSFYINSKNIDCDCKTNFRVNLPTTVKNIRKVTLDYANIPNLIHNVTTENNVISINHNNVVYSNNIPTGIYGWTKLRTALENALNNNGSGLSFWIYLNAEEEVVISTFDPDLPTPVPTTDILAIYDDKSIFPLLNFTYTGWFDNISASLPLDLQSIRALFLTIANIRQPIYSVGTDFCGSFLVPINVNISELSIYEPVEKQVVYINECGISLNQLHIILGAPSGRIILESNWSFQLTFHHD